MGPGRSAAILASERGHVDDAAMAAIAKISAENLAAEEGAAEIHRDHRVELLGRNLHDRASHRHRGIVDQRVHDAPARQRCGQRRLELLFVADIERLRDRRLPGRIERRSDAARGLRVDVGNHHAVSALMQRLSDRLADAATGAGDDRDPRPLGPGLRHRMYPMPVSASVELISRTTLRPIFNPPLARARRNSISAV